MAREAQCPPPTPLLKVDEENVSWSLLAHHPSPQWTELCPELRVQSPLGRGSSRAHETALSALSLNGRSMGSSEEQKRLFCVTSLISRATETCYR